MTAPAKPSNVAQLATTGKTLTPAAVASSTRWLEVWSPADPLPDGVAATLPALVIASEAAIAPADVKAFAVAMDELVGWAEQFGVIPMERDKVARGRQIEGIVLAYQAQLSDLPADLLMSAIRRTMADHRYRTLPLPGDIRGHAADELRDRKYRLMRLKTAADIARRSKPEPMAPRERTPQSAEMAAQMMAAVNSIDAAPKKVPAERSDLKDEPNERPSDAIRRVMAETKGFRKIDRSQFAPATPTPDGAA